MKLFNTNNMHIVNYMPAQFCTRTP